MEYGEDYVGAYEMRGVCPGSDVSESERGKVAWTPNGRNKPDEGITQLSLGLNLLLPVLSVPTMLTLENCNGPAPTSIFRPIACEIFLAQAPQMPPTENRPP